MQTRPAAIRKADPPVVSPVIHIDAEAAQSNGAAGEAAEAGDHKSVTELVTAVSNDLSTLVRQEIAFARAEMRESVTKAAASAGMFGVAVGAVHFMLLFLLLAAMFGLGEVMAYGWAALTVAGALGLVAGVLALVGGNTARSLHPHRAGRLESLKEDLQWSRNRNR